MFDSQQTCLCDTVQCQASKTKTPLLLISTVLCSTYNMLFFSPHGEDTKTAQPTYNTGKGNGRQVRNVFAFATDSKTTSRVTRFFPVNL